MHTPPWTPLLRGVILADAAISGLSAVILIAAAGALSGLFGLPQPLLVICGVLFLPFSAALAFVASRPEAMVAAVWAIIAANGGWVVACIAVLFTGWIAPTPLGVAFVIAQAVVVAVLAEIQFIALRRQPAIAA